MFNMSNLINMSTSKSHFSKLHLCKCQTFTTFSLKRYFSRCFLLLQFRAFNYLQSLHIEKYYLQYVKYICKNQYLLQSTIVQLSNIISWKCQQMHFCNSQFCKCQICKSPFCRCQICKSPFCKLLFCNL